MCNEIDEFLRPTIKKTLLALIIFLYIVGWMAFYSLVSTAKISSLNEAFIAIPALLLGPLLFSLIVIATLQHASSALWLVLILTYAVSYFLSACILMKNKQKYWNEFLKPNMLTLKLFLFLFIFMSLALAVGKLPLFLYFMSIVPLIVNPSFWPVGWSSGYPLFNLAPISIFLTLLFIFYAVLAYLKKSYENSKELQQILRLDAPKATVSVFLYAFFSFLLFTLRSEYYFPFYNRAYMDPIHFLMIDFLLGCILVFPIASFLIFRIKGAIRNQNAGTFQFIEPNWDKVLVLLAIFYVFASFNLSLSFTYTSTTWFFGNLYAAFFFVLLWYCLSYLVLLAWEKLKVVVAGGS